MSLDERAILEMKRRMAVRNALLALLRAFEDIYDLPRAIPTKAERDENERASGTKHTDK